MVVCHLQCLKVILTNGWKNRRRKTLNKIYFLKLFTGNSPRSKYFIMKKNFYWLILLLITAITSFAASNAEPLQFTIDLIHVKNDRVGVELICPQMNDATVNFCLPKIVPGTYSIYDYGRFVQ